MLSCAAVLLAAGCGTPVTYLDPTEDSTWTTLDELAAREPTEVRVRGSAAVPVVRARFAADTTRWTDAVSGQEGSAATGDIARITFRTRRAGSTVGVRRGLGIGFVLGAAFGTVEWLADNKSPEAAGKGTGVTLISTLVGGIVGGPLGAALRADEDFRLRREAGDPDTDP